MYLLEADVYQPYNTSFSVCDLIIAVQVYTSVPAVPELTVQHPLHKISVLADVDVELS